MNPALPTILDHLRADLAPDIAAAFLALTTDYLESTGAREGPVSTALGAAELFARFDEPLPRAARPVTDVIARLRDEVVADANHLYHPRYVGHQVSAPLPAAIWTEALIAALNQSVAVAEMSPTGTAIETRVIRWMTELAGWGAGAGGTFTSGGTEANNLAIFGLARKHAERGRHLITCATEHHAVLHPLEWLEKREGFRVDVLPVEPDGRLAPEGFLSDWTPVDRHPDTGQVFDEPRRHEERGSSSRVSHGRDAGGS